MRLPSLTFQASLLAIASLLTISAQAKPSTQNAITYAGSGAESTAFNDLAASRQMRIPTYSGKDSSANRLAKRQTPGSNILVKRQGNYVVLGLLLHTVIGLAEMGYVAKDLIAAIVKKLGLAKMGYAAKDLIAAIVKKLRLFRKGNVGTGGRPTKLRKRDTGSKNILFRKGNVGTGGRPTKLRKRDTGSKRLAKRQTPGSNILVKRQVLRPIYFVLLNALRKVSETLAPLGAKLTLAQAKILRQAQRLSDKLFRKGNGGTGGRPTKLRKRDTGSNILVKRRVGLPEVIVSLFHLVIKFAEEGYELGYAAKGLIASIAKKLGMPGAKVLQLAKRLYARLFRKGNGVNAGRPSQVAAVAQLHPL